MIRTQQQPMGMSMAATPLLRMSSQTTTLDSLSRISRLPSREIAEIADEEQNSISSALAVVLQIASLSPGSHRSLARWTLQRPSCEFEEISGSGDVTDDSSTKSRWRQLAERVVAFIGSVPPTIWAIYLFHRECRKVRELQDQCIAIRQKVIWRDAWLDIYLTCQSAASSVRYYQWRDEPDKEQSCEEALRLYWQTCAMILESAKDLCKLVEKTERKDYFRPSLIRNLKLLKDIHNVP